MARRYFGTDGIRGLANRTPMTSEVALRVGMAAGKLFSNGGGRPHRVVIGKDTRLSGYMIESALMSGFTAVGMDVFLLGPMPTPAVAMLTRSLRADLGVMISASHNPFEDNGIKFFSGDGLKLPDAMEAQMEELIASGAIDRIRPGAHEIGKAYRINDAVGRYIEFAKNSFPKRLTLRGLKIVVDCGHGATYRVSPTVLRELGAEVVALNVAPDGVNINAGCGSLYPAVLQEAVVAEGAHLGFTHDGDGDRTLCVDERGALADGDQILAMCALDMLADGRLPARTVVATIMSNAGLDVAMRQAGIRVVRTPVGDRSVLEEMLRGGYALGGEQSGHVIFAEHNTTGDGIVTVLQVLATMLRAGKPLSELAACMPRFPQVLENVRVQRMEDFSTLPAVLARIQQAEDALAGVGRVLVRYSGTEPLARVMVEGPDEAAIRGWAGQIATAIREALG